MLDQTEKHPSVNGKMHVDLTDTSDAVKHHQPSTGKRNIFVDALAILFGISSWIGVTSIFLQLPLIVSTAPEGWSLPSYLGNIFIQATVPLTVQSNKFVRFYMTYQYV